MSESGMPELMSVQQAMRILDAVPVRTRPVRLPLADCDGLRLAQSLVSDRDYPPFNKSLMDGYAVRQADVAGGPAALRVVGEAAAGRPAGPAIGPGEAIAVMTGAPIPDGADGVIPVEDVEKIGTAAVRIVPVSYPPLTLPTDYPV